MKNEIAIIIPCFKVKKHISKVINDCLKMSSNIYIVDDLCPLKTGNYVEKKFKHNKNVKVISLSKNLGVGGASINGIYHAIKKKNVKYIFKVDGDDQMDVRYIKKMKYYLFNFIKV